MKNNDVAHPQYILNRHHSWMQFNQRVLEEARDQRNPLLERVKFLAITASNLDEFVEVRVAGMLQLVEHGNCEPGPDGLAPADVLKELAETIHSFVKAQYDCWREELLPALAAESVRVVSWKKLGPAARLYVENYYIRSVEPLLTPVTVDPAHPFPHVLNKALCLAFLLKRKRRGGQIYLGVVTVPRALPRLVLVPTKDGAIEYVFLSDVIQAFANRLYHGYEVLSAAAFRVTRNSNLYLEEEESRSIMDTVDAQLHRRRKGDPALGGSTRSPIMTAYRQQALACASALSQGPRRLRDLKPEMPDAAKILQHNVYGWFDRAERGIYVLTDAGHAALKRWPQQPIDFAGAGDSMP